MKNFPAHYALTAGATKDEIAATVSVAILMGGGPSVVYDIEAMQATEQFIEHSGQGGYA